MSLLPIEIVVSAIDDAAASPMANRPIRIEIVCFIANLALIPTQQIATPVQPGISVGRSTSEASLP